MRDTVPIEFPAGYDGSVLLEQLARVLDPELDESILDLGFVRSLRLRSGQAEVALRLPTSWGVSVMAKGMGSGNATMHAFSEITFPPFGFVMTFDDQPLLEHGFCEISSFANFRYADWRTAITMRLPVMPIYTGFPGDYRTREQTVADYAQNKAIEAAASLHLAY